MLKKLRTLLVLGRISNLPTVWTNAAAGWFLSGGGRESELLWILAGISLLYLAGMTLNDAFDARWDREHAPERPVPSGAISLPTVWIVGLGQMAAGTALLLILTSVRLELVLGLIAAILLYDWIHKKWKGSVLLMGLCRAFVYLGAGSAVATHTETWQVPGAVVAVAAMVVAYIAGLTLAARDEHDPGKKGTSFPVRLLLTLPVLFPLVVAHGTDHDFRSVALTVLGVITIWAWIAESRRALARRIPDGIARFIAGIALYDAVLLALADWPVALCCVGAFLLTLFLQRFVPGT